MAKRVAIPSTQLNAIWANPSLVSKTEQNRKRAIEKKGYLTPIIEIENIKEQIRLEVQGNNMQETLNDEGTQSSQTKFTKDNRFLICAHISISLTFGPVCTLRYM